MFIDSFPIEGGRGKFVAADIVEPDERPDDEYPVILTTGRQLEHWHTGSMTRRATVLRCTRARSSGYTLSREELAKIGAKAGDMIRVSTRRGSIDIMAREDVRRTSRGDLHSLLLRRSFCQHAHQRSPRPSG